MSFSDDVGPLLGPLVGKTATFLVEGRQANVSFGRALMGYVAKADGPCIVLDLDALYSSNADQIFSGIPKASPSLTVSVPAPGSDIESEFSSLFRTPQAVVVIDSLNTLYHLISMEDGSSRGRKMAFALASLSQYARENGSAAILSMYRRQGLARPGKGRSISNLTDVTASVEISAGRMEISTERGSAWPGGAFSSRIP